MSDFQYEDIINMPYPNPEIEKDFPDTILRAAQFAPFAALTGHDEAIEETARLTDSELELDEYTKAEINGRLQYIAEHIEDKETVSITYFVTDKKKSGGAYITKKGNITKIREYERDVILDDGTEIPLDNIFSIEGNQFDKIEGI